MKKLWISVVVLAILSALLASGCMVVATGPVINKTYDNKDFNEIEISSAFSYEVSQSSSYGVSISARQSVFDHLEVSQSGHTLSIRLTVGSFTNTEAKVTISAPALSRLTVSGACSGTAKGFQSSDSLDLSVSGASRLDMSMESGPARLNVTGASTVTGALKSQDTRITVSGASRCTLDGSAANTDIDISGASTFSASGFQMHNSDITVSGASHAEIYSSGELSLNVSGASTLLYSGNPNIKKMESSGASTVKSK